MDVNVLYEKVRDEPYVPSVILRWIEKAELPNFEEIAPCGEYKRPCTPKTFYILFSRLTPVILGRLRNGFRMLLEGASTFCPIYR